MTVAKDPPSDKMAAFKSAMESKNATRTDKFVARSHALSAVTAKVESMATEEEKEAVLEAFRQEQNRCLRLQRKRCTTDDFEVLQTIGQGAFGVVRLVRHKEDREVYALKQMPKRAMKKKNQRDRVVAEKHLLSRMEDTWVGTLYHTFQDENNLYMVMEYLPGGDMMSHLIRLDVFTEHQTQFYIAQLLEAVHSVHKLGYIHRDIKPDNIALTRRGHLKLLDFGLCKYDECIKKAENDPVGISVDNVDVVEEVIVSPAPVQAPKVVGRGDFGHLKRTNLKSSVGTPQYMAPEVFKKEYDQAADIWSVGIIMYECLMGGVPFSDGKNCPEKIMAKVINYKRHLYIPYPGKKMSPHAEDLLKHILCDKEHRYNYRQIRSHPYFSGVDFVKLHEYVPPIRPDVRSMEDASYFERFDEVPLPVYKPAGQQKDKNLDYVGYTYKKGDEVPDVNAILEAAQGML